MKNKWCFSRLARATSFWLRILLASMTLVLASAPAASAGDAPQWMHGLVNAPLPAHDEKADAVLMYSDTNVNVQSVDKIKTTVRAAYKFASRWTGAMEWWLFHSTPTKRLRAFTAGAFRPQGKDYEVKDKDAVERSLPKVENGNLIDDAKEKLLLIPAADVGNIIGYEYVVEERPVGIAGPLAVPGTAAGEGKPLLPAASAGLGVQGDVAELSGGETGARGSRAMAVECWRCEGDTGRREHAPVAGRGGTHGGFVLSAGWRWDAWILQLAGDGHLAKEPEHWASRCFTGH